MSDPRTFYNVPRLPGSAFTDASFPTPLVFLGVIQAKSQTKEVISKAYAETVIEFATLDDQNEKHVLTVTVWGELDHTKVTKDSVALLLGVTRPTSTVTFDGDGAFTVAPWGSVMFGFVSKQSDELVQALKTLQGPASNDWDLPPGVSF